MLGSMWCKKSDCYISYNFPSINQQKEKYSIFNFNIESKLLTQFDEVNHKDGTGYLLPMELSGTSFVQNKEIPLAKKINA